ncbi:MAG: glycoside hydrolase family 130 protein [Defluviitaleaceae bacterium]|nr:glycoside hydrolase family 130 protein [Defluviitaleaceae bacterium]
MAKILGEQTIPNMPWEAKPNEHKEVLWRYSGNPIFKLNPGPKAARVFNSAVIPYGDEFVGVFRADHKDITMHLHFGRSKDAINWELEDEDIKWVDESGKPFQPAYGYDPRVTKIGDDYFIMWCTSFGGAPTIGLGKTRDFKTFTRLENAFLPHNRNGVLFPRRIGGNYVLLSRPSDNGHTPFGDIFLSESPDMTFWGKHRSVMKAGGSWQSLKIGAGPIPIETDEGWLMIYHGVVLTCNGYVYSFGAALLDLENPSKVLYRSGNYLLTPEEPYETIGFVQNVCFPCASLVDAPTGRIAIYYGTADTYTGIAFGMVDDIIKFTKETNNLLHGDNELGRD